MQKYKKIKHIKDLIFKYKKLMVEDIVNLINVSEPTARRYINEIASSSKEYLKITNGISVSNALSEAEYLFEEKLRINSEKKKLIAKKCSEFIKDNSVLIIDSGSTCYFLAEEIADRNIIVVTTDLNISMVLSKNKNISLHTVGGNIRHGYFSICGPVAAENLKMFNSDIAVMSVDAIDINRGITNAETFEVSIKQQIRNSAKKLIILADSSKFNKVSFYYIMGIEEVDMIITDSDADKNIISEIEKKNIKVVIA